MRRIISRIDFLLLAIILLFIMSFCAQAQVVVWEENFDSYASGTNTSTKWTVNYSSTTRFAVIDGRFQGSDLGATNRTWFSQTIDISGHSRVRASMQLMAAGGVTSSDEIRAFYRINGGTWTTFEINGVQRDGFFIADASTYVITGNTLELAVRMNNGDANEIYQFDNVKVLSDDAGHASKL
jgi:hypothetical protein